MVLAGGTCESISSAGGKIKSPDYPNSYGTNKLIVYTIAATPGQKIQLTFTDFVLVPFCAFLSVSISIYQNLERYIKYVDNSLS